MHIYLSGPMSGYKDWNFPAFHDATSDLRARGHTVYNPAEIDGGATDHPRAFYMREAIRAFAEEEFDAIVLLPGWQSSDGARLERIMAQELEVDAYLYRAGEPVDEIPAATQVTTDTEPVDRETILEEATRVVDGPRGADYGHPFDNDSRIAQIWSAILSGTLGMDIELPAHAVAPMMIGLKLSRHAHRRTRDNLVDIAGYARTAEMVEDKQQELLRAGQGDELAVNQYE